jgi:hypothetical protein
VANKGGVRGEGTVGRLLAMVQEMGGGPVRCGGTRRTVALGRLDRVRETRAGLACQWGEERGRPGGPVEGH